MARPASVWLTDELILAAEARAYEQFCAGGPNKPCFSDGLRALLLKGAESFPKVNRYSCVHCNSVHGAPYCPQTDVYLTGDTDGNVKK